MTVALLPAAACSSDATTVADAPPIGPPSTSEETRPTATQPDDEAANGSPPLGTTAGAPGSTTTAPATTLGEIDGAAFVGWADDVIRAFETFERERRAAGEAFADAIAELLHADPDPPLEQVNALHADRLNAQAEAGVRMIAELPADAPVASAEQYAIAVEAHAGLVAATRDAAVALLAGDTGPWNQLAPALERFETACLDLQFVVLEQGGGLVSCGVAGEDASVRDFVEGPTVADFGDAELVAMPAGVYTIDYLEPRTPGVNVGFPTTLSYDQDLWIRTSPTMIELVSNAGASLRLLVTGEVADPTQLSDTITNVWPLRGDPSGWLGALDGVDVVTTGDGDIAGYPARFWEIVSSRPDAIAVLADGEDWLPDTTLEPGIPMRLWWFDLDGHSLLVTEQPGDHATLEAAAGDLDMLRAGLAVTID